MLRILAILLLLLGACADGTAEEGGGTLDILFVPDDGLGDPALGGADMYERGALHVGLTALAPDGRVVPALASSWRVTDDGRGYVFKLRPMAWPDGRKITAGDVVVVLRRILAPGSHAPLKPYLMDIENAAEVAANRRPARMLGVDDPREDVVVISLTQPNPDLLTMLAHPSAAIVRSDEPPPPSGPYARRSELLVPRGSEEEREGRIPLRVDTAPSLADAIDAFHRGEVDIVTGSATTGLRAASAPMNAAAFRAEPSWGVYGYLANTFSGPLAEPGVRRALAMTVPRTELVTETFGVPGMQAAYGPLSPNLDEAYAGAVPDWAVWSQEARRAEAARLLSEAGYGPERPLALDVAITGALEHETALAVVAEAWAPLGVRVRADKRDPEAHRRAVEAGDYDLALVERIAPAPIPGYFLRPFTCEVRAGGYCNRSVDRLLVEAAAEEGPGERVQLVRRAARLVAEDAPFIALFAPVRWSLVRAGVEGWQPNMAGAHPPQALRLTAG